MIATRHHPSPNHEARRGTDAPDMVILHYTGMVDAAAAIAWLAAPQSGVSCHYVVDEDGTVVRMVDEERRAWHAGVSFWRGATDINSRSIGIEIHNPGHTIAYRDFPPAQVEAVVRLLDDIRARWRVPDRHVLAHSDVAPLRKIDPGERFPWAFLAARGHGIVAGEEIDPPPAPMPAAAIQADLRRIGYGVEATGVFDRYTATVLSAFQRHFAPHRVDGVPDGETVARLRKIAAAMAG